VRASGLDPRAQLAILAALLLATLFGGGAGLVVGVGAAAIWITAQPGRSRALRMVAAVVPLAVAVAALDALTGRTAEGVAAALRLVAVTALAIGFTRTADARAIAEGLRAMRVPYPLVFVLVVGARFVPVAAGDMSELTDAARLRGITVSGPVWRRMADWTVLLVPLLVLTIRRGLQLGEAMEARGFSDGVRSTRVADLHWRGRDTAVLAAAAAALGAVLLFDLLGR
jgi:energy-coupling factor transporter transmembrane protein EcfT